MDRPCLGQQAIGRHARAFGPAVQARNIPKARHPDIVYDTNHGGLALVRDEAEFHPGAKAA
jgi:hypothetical protein